MAWIPTKEVIVEEANDYENLTFFKKSKNVMAVFIVAVSVLSLFFIDLVGDGAIYGISFYLVLAVFVYLNHRWAMVLWCLMYLGDKVIFLLDRVGSPVSQIIFGAIALALTYSSFRVANELKKKQKQQ